MCIPVETVKVERTKKNFLVFQVLVIFVLLLRLPYFQKLEGNYISV